MACGPSACPTPTPTSRRPPTRCAARARSRRSSPTCRCSAPLSGEAHMTIEDLRIAVTAISFLVFLGLLAWAWSARNRRGFDEAAHLPFAHDGAQATDAHPTLRSERP